MSVSNLYKEYRGGIVALRGLTFESNARVLALVGPNGAGKTTFVRISTGLLKPTRGEVHVLGLDVEAERFKLKKIVSLVPQDSRPDMGCTPYEHVKYYLFSRGYSLRDAKRRAREVLEEVGLWERRNELCSRLSGGMRRLVVLAMALAPEVEVVFLDEPTSGLDPANKVKVWGILRRVARGGVHVLVTSHDMSEVEERADEVVMINRGKLVAKGAPEKLVSSVSHLTRLELTSWHDKEAVLRLLKEAPETERVIDLGSVIIAYAERGDVPALITKLSDLGVEASIYRCGLRDVFLRWTS